MPFKEIKPKSGEGVVSKFAEMRPATDENGKPLKGQYSLQVLADRLEIVLGEVTYLAAAVGMDGSTLLSLCWKRSATRRSAVTRGDGRPTWYYRRTPIA